MQACGVAVQDIGECQCGIVTFTKEGVDLDALQADLAARRINVTTSSQFSTRFDMEARNLAKVVRSSVHYYNNEDEIDRFCRAIAAAG